MTTKPRVVCHLPYGSLKSPSVSKRLWTSGRIRLSVGFLYSSCSLTKASLHAKNFIANSFSEYRPFAKQTMPWPASKLEVRGKKSVKTSDLHINVGSESRSILRSQWPVHQNQRTNDLYINVGSEKEVFRENQWAVHQGFQTMMTCTSKVGSEKEVFHKNLGTVYSWKPTNVVVSL